MRFDPNPSALPRFCAMPRVVPEVPPPPSAGARKCVVKRDTQRPHGKIRKNGKSATEAIMKIATITGAGALLFSA